MRQRAAKLPENKLREDYWFLTPAGPVWAGDSFDQAWNLRKSGFRWWKRPPLVTRSVYYEWRRV